TGTNYSVAAGLATYQAPSGTATTLTLSDDSETTITLTSPFHYLGGTTSSLTVCSNGFVSVASGNGTQFQPSVATLLGAPQTAWWNWHDFNPAATGSGSVKFEEILGTACITWDGVWDFGGTSAANASIWQLQFDESNGNVSWVWSTMSPLGGITNTGFLVGYSPGGASTDPGTRDLSATMPFSTGSSDSVPLDLSSTG